MIYIVFLILFATPAYCAVRHGIFALMRRMKKSSEAVSLPSPAMPKEPEALAPPKEPETLGMRGATPLHYRAFSLLRSRLTSEAAGEQLVRLRERAKTIKLHEQKPVRDEALVVLDRFVQIADEFAPLFDQADSTEATALVERLVATMKLLENALEDILQGCRSSSDRFDQLTRFVEIRYASEETYGLTN